VIATHPDPNLSRTKAYAGKWNSQQAEAVRKLRDERDQLLAERSAQPPSDAIKKLNDARLYWAMGCPCNCAECRKIDSAIRLVCLPAMLAGHIYSPREGTEVCGICGFHKREHAPEHMPAKTKCAAP
jgi:hypothetical protein